MRWLASACVLLAACGGGGAGAPGEPGTLVVTPGSDARLELDDGSFVAVPGGAVTSEVTLTAEAIASPTAPPGMVLVSKTLRMGPEGQMFAEPVEIGIPIMVELLPDGRSAQDVVVLRAPSGTAAFVPIPTQIVGTSAVGRTEHFSDFVAAIAVGDTPAECGNGTCSNVETCSSCPVDCDLCPPNVYVTTRDELVAQLTARIREDYPICAGNGLAPTNANLADLDQWIDTSLDRDAVATGLIQIDFARANHALDVIRAWPRCAADVEWLYAVALYGSVRGAVEIEAGFDLVGEGAACADSSWCELGLRCAHDDACAGTCEVGAASPLGTRCRTHADCAPTSTPGALVVCAPGENGFDVCREQTVPAPLAVGAACVLVDDEDHTHGLVRAGCGASAFCDWRGPGIVDGAVFGDTGVCTPFFALGASCDDSDWGICGEFARCNETASGSGTRLCYASTIVNADGACDDDDAVIGRGTRVCGAGLLCNEGTGTCQSRACVVNSQCAAGQYCNGTNCDTRKANGAECEEDTACISGRCDYEASPAVCAQVTRSPTSSSPETCDGIDNDCDGTTDEDLPLLSLYEDEDFDGYYGASANQVAWCGPFAEYGFTTTPGDCAPDDASVNPGRQEFVGNGTDDDCDSSTPDEGTCGDGICAEDPTTCPADCG